MIISTPQDTNEDVKMVDLADDLQPITEKKREPIIDNIEHLQQIIMIYGKICLNLKLFQMRC
jgi:hypothetical protein